MRANAVRLVLALALTVFASAGQAACLCGLTAPLQPAHSVQPGAGDAHAAHHGAAAHAGHHGAADAGTPGAAGQAAGCFDAAQTCPPAHGVWAQPAAPDLSAPILTLAVILPAAPAAESTPPMRHAVWRPAAPRPPPLRDTPVSRRTLLLI